ncbi:MAG: hypothetical protein AAB726_02320 [Patescibacteria group bacterium]
MEQLVIDVVYHPIATVETGDVARIAQAGVGAGGGDYRNFISFAVPVIEVNGGGTDKQMGYFIGGSSRKTLCQSVVMAGALQSFTPRV